MLDREYDHERERDGSLLEAVAMHMARAYCTAMDVGETTITVHAHENGTTDDRLLTLHIATGPLSAARMIAHSMVSDLAAHVFAAQQQHAGRH